MTREEYIHKQDVLNKIREVCFSKEWRQFRVNYGSHGVRDFLINYISELPPDPTPEKIGHWVYDEACSDWYDTVYKCSCCKRRVSFSRTYETEDDVYKNYPYCHCGAKMVKPQESEDKE